LLPQLQSHSQRVNIDPFPQHFLIAASVRSVNAKVTAGIEENWLRFAKEALIQLKVVSLVYALCSAVCTVSAAPPRATTRQQQLLGSLDPCRAWTPFKTSPTRSQKLRRSPGCKFNAIVSIAAKIAPIRFGRRAPIHTSASGQCRGEFTRTA
jgi:hypothetical protein